MPEQSKTVDAALSVLTLLAGGDDQPTAASLARRLGMSRTAVARLLATLEAHGLARRMGRGWGPGLGLLTLASGIEPRLRGLARAELEDLARRFGETAVLSVREGDEAVAVDQVVGGAGVVRIHYRIGTRHPLRLGASGRALLDEHAGEVVVSEGELEPGVRGAAAAVLGAGGRPVASIALVAPAHRFPAEGEATEAVAAAARRITEGLAGPPSAGPPDTVAGGRDAVLPAGR
ncbi:MAG TPA: helix-turn-helix domain-containing protein [Acidimicrobiales bacterium]|nr:helix-turn-helix domain-containing protein [Acidimicrobiales bacterium]